MGKKSIVSALSLALAVASLLSPVPASAASIGACSSGNATYASGENETGVRNGIQANMIVPSGAGPCTPDDNSGINAASANMGINYGNAFIEAGLIRCNTTNNSAWPASLCDGRLHFFVEQHGQFSWDYNMWDHGVASLGTTYQFTIQYFSSDKTYHVSVGALHLRSVNMGSGLVPQQTNGYYWQAETKDAGDGLGTVSAATNLGQLKTQFTSTWSLHNVGSACNLISSQHHCVVNGSYGFYAYTTN